MLPLVAAGIAAAIAAGKHYAVDKPAADRARKLAADTDRYSPWTGMHGQTPNEPNAFNTILQGGTAGYMLGETPDFASNAEIAEGANSAAAGAPGLSANTGTFGSDLSASPGGAGMGQGLYSDAAPIGAMAAPGGIPLVNAPGQNMMAAGGMSGQMKGLSPWLSQFKFGQRKS